MLSHVEINKVTLCTPGVIRAACALLGGTDKVGTTRHAAQTADTMQLTTRAVLGRSNEATTAATPLVPSGGCLRRASGFGSTALIIAVRGLRAPYTHRGCAAQCS